MIKAHKCYLGVQSSSQQQVVLIHDYGAVLSATSRCHRGKRQAQLRASIGNGASAAVADLVQSVGYRSLDDAVLTQFTRLPVTAEPARLTGDCHSPDICLHRLCDKRSPALATRASMQNSGCIASAKAGRSGTFTTEVNNLVWQVDGRAATGPDLSVKHFSGLTLPNPFVIGSGKPARLSVPALIRYQPRGSHVMSCTLLHGAPQLT